MFLGAHAKGGFLKPLWGWVFDKVMPLCARPPPDLRAVHAQFWCGSHANTISSPHNIICLGDSLAQDQPQNVQKNGQSPALAVD